MQKWICTVCQYVYDPAEGDLVNDVPPGVSFEELLTEWKCPLCKAAKTFFEPFCEPDRGVEEW